MGLLDNNGDGANSASRVTLLALWALLDSGAFDLEGRTLKKYRPLPFAGRPMGERPLSGQNLLGDEQHRRHGYLKRDMKAYPASAGAYSAAPKMADSRSGQMPSRAPPMQTEAAAACQPRASAERWDLKGRLGLSQVGDLDLVLLRLAAKCSLCKHSSLKPVVSRDLRTHRRHAAPTASQILLVAGADPLRCVRLLGPCHCVAERHCRSAARCFGLQGVLTCRLPDTKGASNEALLVPAEIFCRHGQQL